MDLYRSTKTLYLSGAYSDCWLASVDGGESDSLSEPVSTLTETAPAPQTKLVQQNPVSWASLRFVFPPPLSSVVTTTQPLLLKRPNQVEKSEGRLEIRTDSLA